MAFCFLTAPVWPEPRLCLEIYGKQHTGLFLTLVPVQPPGGPLQMAGLGGSLQGAYHVQQSTDTVHTGKRAGGSPLTDGPAQAQRAPWLAQRGQHIDAVPLARRGPNATSGE